jgi:hypothetical protein
VNIPRFAVLDPNVLQDISKDLLEPNGKMKLLSYEYYQTLKWENFRLFCHEYARYGIPTKELVHFIKSLIDGKTALEIGAGSGDLGYHLGIKMTDSKIQDSKPVKRLYELTKQPTIKYGKDVEKLEALEAVKKYKPQVVVASWVTTYSPTATNYGSSPHGINEKEILDLVDTYILIGNLDIHGDKPIMDEFSFEYNLPWNISRAARLENNRIWVWERSK